MIMVALYIPLMHVGKYLLNAVSLTQVERNMLLAVEGVLHCVKRTYVDPLSLYSGRRENEH